MIWSTTDDDGTELKLVLVIPPCGFCFDRDATTEMMTAWGCEASLCPVCAGKIGMAGTERKLVTAAALAPLPTAAEARAYAEAQTYTRARPTFHGRPQAPHEYVLIWKSTDPWMQLRVLAWLRKNGEPRRWGRKTHHYQVWGDWEWWAMPIRETILNRRRLDW
jgi:hypothetical protein